MSHTRIDNVEDAFQEGDEVTFKIVAIDERTGKLRLSRKAIMPRADGTIPTDEELAAEAAAASDRPRRDRGDRGDRRGGRDRRDRSRRD